MAYQLGVDLGTTFTACAVSRDGRVEIATLGDRSAAIPSVLYLREDDTVLTGDAANRRAVTEPERLAREYKRRIGDPVPILLAGTPYSADVLVSKMLRWVMRQVALREGSSPEITAICHPANWGPYKRELVDGAAKQSEIGPFIMLTEPEAAAIFYASTEGMETGDIVAVYDLGGGTFDAAVLQKVETGFKLLGEPQGIERLGGVDFDEAVFAHVREALGGALDELDPN